MQGDRETINCAANAVCDTLRYLGDVSYAVLPQDVAHKLGDLKKAFWSNVRIVIDKELEWIDERVAGGDRLREQWQKGCKSETSEGAPEPVS
jgi:hypothetical protein